MPAVALKQMVMSGFPSAVVEGDVAESIDFMVDNVRLYNLWDGSAMFF